MNAKRETKLAALKIKTYDGPDEYIDILYKQLAPDNPKNPAKIKKKVDCTIEKYQLLLKYVNRILKNIGREEIDNLTKFQKIDRLDIIKENNKQLFVDMNENLFKYFNKNNCGYYRNKKSPNIALNCLRGMVKEMGFDFTRKKVTKCKGSTLVLHYVYSIDYRYCVDNKNNKNI